MSRYENGRRFDDEPRCWECGQLMPLPDTDPEDLLPPVHGPQTEVQARLTQMWREHQPSLLKAFTESMRNGLDKPSPLAQFARTLEFPIQL